MPIGSIYSIRSKSCPNLIYIGSTTQTLAKRKGGHWAAFNRWKAGGNFVTAFKVLEIAHALGDRNDCYIELIRTVTFTNKAELLREEGIEMRKIECVNKNVAGQTISEHYVLHRKEILEKVRIYRLDHLDEKKEQNRKYGMEHRDSLNENARERIHCECCDKNISRGDLSKHKKTAKHIKNAGNI